MLSTAPKFFYRHWSAVTQYWLRNGHGWSSLVCRHSILAVKWPRMVVTGLPSLNTGCGMATDGRHWSAVTQYWLWNGHGWSSLVCRHSILAVEWPWMVLVACSVLYKSQFFPWFLKIRAQCFSFLHDMSVHCLNHDS